MRHPRPSADRHDLRPQFHPRGARTPAALRGAEVNFAAAAPETNQDIDSAYHAEYDRYGPAIVGHVTGPAAHAVTIRMIKAAQ